MPAPRKKKSPSIGRNEDPQTDLNPPRRAVQRWGREVLEVDSAADRDKLGSQSRGDSVPLVNPEAPAPEAGAYGNDRQNARYRGGEDRNRSGH